MLNIDFNYTSSVIAIASGDSNIRIFDIRRLQEKRNFVGHQNSVNKLIWSTYNNYLISAGDDRAIIIWEINPI